MSVVVRHAAPNRLHGTRRTCAVSVLTTVSTSKAPGPGEKPGTCETPRPDPDTHIDSDTESGTESDQTAGLDFSPVEKTTRKHKAEGAEGVEEEEEAETEAEVVEPTHLSMSADLLSDANSFVECFLAIPSGLERASDYIRYVYTYGDLQVPTPFVDQIRKRSRRLRRTFEKLESYCLENGCYVIGHDDKGLDVRKTRQLLAVALVVCKKCVPDFVYMARLVSRCAMVCHTSASIAGEWHRGKHYRALALDERRAYQTYRAEMLKPLSDSGGMVQDVFALSTRLVAALRNEEKKGKLGTQRLTALLCQVREALLPFHSMFRSPCA